MRSRLLCRLAQRQALRIPAQPSGSLQSVRRLAIPIKGGDDLEGTEALKKRKVAKSDYVKGGAAGRSTGAERVKTVDPRRKAASIVAEALEIDMAESLGEVVLDDKAAKKSGKAEAAVLEEATLPSFEGLFSKQKSTDSSPAAMTPIAERVEKLPGVYTAQALVSEHSAEDVGKFYQVQRGDAMPGFPVALDKAMEAEFHGSRDYMMIREPAFGFVQQMKKLESGDDKSIAGKRFGISGRKGCGKSAAVHYIAQFAAQRPNWLVLGTAGDEFPKDLLGLIQVNPHRTQVFDQPPLTQQWIGDIVKGQKEALSQIKLKRKYKYALAGDTLYDLAVFASNPENVADVSTTLYDFIEEARMATEVPVLVAIDSINAWDGVSDFPDPDNLFRRLPAARLALVDAMATFMLAPPVNGATVFALTHHAKLMHGGDHLSRADAILKCEPYSDAELANAVQHYAVSNVIVRQLDSDQHFLGSIKILTGAVPRELQRNAILL